MPARNHDLGGVSRGLDNRLPRHAETACGALALGLEVRSSQSTGLDTILPDFRRGPPGDESTSSEADRWGTVGIISSRLLEPRRIRRRKLYEAVLPFAAIFLAVLVALAPAVMARLGLGIDQPFTATRYLPLQALLLIGIYVFVLTLGGYDRRWRWAGVALAILVCLGSVATYRQGLIADREQFREQTACRDVLVHYRSRKDSEVLCYYPNPALARQRAFWLEQLHMSVFRNAPEETGTRQ